MPFWASLCGLFADFLSGSLYLYCLICLVPSGNNFLFIPLIKFFVQNAAAAARTAGSGPFLTFGNEFSD